MTTISENNLDVKNHQTTDLGEFRVKITGPKYDGEVHYDDEVVSLDRGRIIWSLLISEGWQRNRNRYVAK